MSSGGDARAVHLVRYQLPPLSLLSSQSDAATYVGVTAENLIKLYQTVSDFVKVLVYGSGCSLHTCPLPLL